MALHVRGKWKKRYRRLVWAPAAAPKDAEETLAGREIAPEREGIAGGAKWAPW